VKRIRPVALALLAVGPGAAGQSFTPDSSITFSLRRSEHAGNGNGVIEPGESIYFALDVSFTNQNGIANFSPPVGTFGSGTVRGLGSGFVDLHGMATSGDARGTWDVDQSAGYGINPDWDVCGGDSCNGSSANGGADLVNVLFAQFNPTPASIMTTNPIITIWSGLWTPASYDPRAVTFRPAGAAAGGTSIASVALRLSETAAYSVFVVPGNLLYGSATIPIVPAPSSLAAVGGVLFVRRHRR
jgi:hypothetical protein